ncbi:MAG: GNAT family N-acetyltransferase [Coriobacteriales bacterium]|jgi:RimJ/RimL family protein N-acetyltransferase|nr:GNAT family N-acetyltransferase [Coriobacteriales bacterium]
MPLLTYQPVYSEDQIAAMAALGREIWLDYWPERIGQAQTEYMLETMHSAEAIAASIKEQGYRWVFARDEAGQVVGYSSAAPESVEAASYDPTIHGDAINAFAAHRLFISKIYLKAGERGKHYCSAIIDYWADWARQLGLEALYLTVNKYNELGVRAYKHLGFRTIEERQSDIGNGYFMDDFVMAKKLAI